jgi:hypothetical protein
MVIRNQAIVSSSAEALGPASHFFPNLSLAAERFGRNRR